MRGHQLNKEFKTHSHTPTHAPPTHTYTHSRIHRHKHTHKIIGIVIYRASKNLPRTI